MDFTKHHLIVRLCLSGIDKSKNEDARRGNKLKFEVNIP